MNDIYAFQQCLTSSRKVLALVGAGLSASSGLPTFRGTGGLWKGYEAAELATPDAFLMDPGLVWQFYSARRVSALKAKPNKGHKALAALGKKLGSDKFLTLTQNVDGLSSRAKHPAKSLLHLHGDLFHVKCTSFSCSYDDVNYDMFLTPRLKELYESQSHSEDHKHNNNTNDSRLTDDLVRDIQIEDLPQCPRCRSLLRPGVVWFGEPLPLRVLDQADNFVTSGEVDLILVIGTSGTVWPAAGYVEQVMKRGGKVAVFNIERTEADFMFEGDAAVWLPKLLEPIIGRV